MKTIFDYINGNSFLSTIIGIIIGWILNFISTLYFNKKEENRRRKEFEREERKNSFENKPELCFVKNKKNKKVDIEIFLGTFEVHYDEKKDYKIVYSKNIKDKNNHEFKDIIVKNIGKSDIDCLNIISTNKKGVILITYNLLEMLVNNESVWYSCCYDRKIRVGEEIKIRIYFEKNKQPYTLFSSTLSLLFEDQNHNYWEQPYFYEKDNVYSPFYITYKDYRERISADDAYNCFEHPWLW